MLPTGVCPSEALEVAARPCRPRLLYQAIYHLRREGVLWTLRRLLQKVGVVSPRASGSQRRTGTVESVSALHLQPGELVEVKSRDEILATLDASGRNRGLLFLPQMELSCGRRFRVHKRLERMYLEGSGEVKKIRDTVLLQNVFCDGANTGCDKSCFLYWREAWLKRVAECSSSDQLGGTPEQ